MDKRRFALVLAFALALPLVALAQSKGGGVAGWRWGFIFDARNLSSLDGFEDGYQAGAGVMCRPLPKLAVRALLSVDHQDPEGTVLPTETVIGLGIAGQWHPAEGKSVASPYIGGTAGFRTQAITDEETAIDLYFGAVFGVEAKIVGPVSLFGEYQLLASLDSAGFTLTLGTGTDRFESSRALLGLIIYF